MTVTRLNWPSLSRRPSSWSFKPIANTQTWTSPLNSSTQTLEFPGMRWWCKCGWEKLREDDWRVFEAWVAQMRGMAGRVLMTPLQGERPRGVATGTPLVSGAGQTGRSLVTSGWTHSTPLILRIGDYFSVATASGPELKIITADAASDSSGNATLAFEPPLRNSPANGAAITTTNPVCPMRFVDNSQGETAFVNPRYESSTIELVESWL